MKNKLSGDETPKKTICFIRAKANTVC